MNFGRHLSNFLNKLFFFFKITIQHAKTTDPKEAFCLKWRKATEGLSFPFYPIRPETHPKILRDHGSKVGNPRLRAKSVAWVSTAQLRL